MLYHGCEWGCTSCHGMMCFRYASSSVIITLHFMNTVEWQKTVPSNFSPAIVTRFWSLNYILWMKIFVTSAVFATWSSKFSLYLTKHCISLSCAVHSLVKSTAFVFLVIFSVWRSMCVSLVFVVTLVLVRWPLPTKSCFLTQRERNNGTALDPLMQTVRFRYATHGNVHGVS